MESIIHRGMSNDLNQLRDILALFLDKNFPG